MAGEAVGPSVMTGRDQLRGHRHLPSIWRMAVGAVSGDAINGARMRTGRRVTITAHIFHGAEIFVGMTLDTVHAGMFTGQCDRVIERMLGPGRFGRVAAAAWDGDAVGTDVARLAVFWAAHLVFLVALLAALHGHHTLQACFLMHGNDAAVAARAGEGRVPVRIQILGRVANRAITDFMRIGRRRDRVCAIDVDEATMAVGALLVLVFGMVDDQRGAWDLVGKRAAGMAVQAARVVDISLGGYLVTRRQMRDEMLRAGDVDLDVAGDARLGMAVHTCDAVV